MTRVLIGDIFTTRMQCIVNTVNCEGVMGKGIAKEFKRRYPDMYSDYKDKCDNNLVIPGIPYKFESNDLFRKHFIINFPTKNHWRSPSKLSDIVTGLDYFAKHYKEWGVKSIAFPPLGCGNGGLEWSIVGRIMYQKLSKLDIEIEIFAPYGTPETQLRKEFLESEIQFDNDKLIGKVSEKIQEGWIPILECVYQIQKNVYSPKIGRVKFQKIAYILTELGIDTGLDFKQASYGPYSEKIKAMINILSNSNILKEEKLGSMIHLIINEEYVKLREEHSALIAKYKSKIAKTADLFQRIKTTDKVEEVSSIIYKVKELKRDNKNVTDLEVLNSLLEWKKHWAAEEKKKSLIESIRNLAMLNWIKIEFSPELDYVEIY